MFLAARSRCIKPLLIKWYMPREIWLAIKTKFWVVNIWKRERVSEWGNEGMREWDRDRWERRREGGREEGREGERERDKMASPHSWFPGPAVTGIWGFPWRTWGRGAWVVRPRCSGRRGGGVGGGGKQDEWPSLPPVETAPQSLECYLVCVCGEG